MNAYMNVDQTSHNQFPKDTNEYSNFCRASHNQVPIDMNDYSTVNQTPHNQFPIDMNEYTNVDERSGYQVPTDLKEYTKVEQPTATSAEPNKSSVAEVDPKPKLVLTLRRSNENEFQVSRKESTTHKPNASSSYEYKSIQPTTSESSGESHINDFEGFVPDKSKLLEREFKLPP